MNSGFAHRRLAWRKDSAALPKRFAWNASWPRSNQSRAPALPVALISGSSSSSPGGMVWPRSFLMRERYFGTSDVSGPLARYCSYIFAASSERPRRCSASPWSRRNVEIGCSLKASAQSAIACW